MSVKYLTEHYDKPEFVGLDGYKKHGGYVDLEKALKMQPKAIVDEVKASGLRGRGGAGFPTGMKWSFLPENGETRYLLCNADEGEPGTFKDRYMMEKAPHQLIEGMIISAFAVKSPKSYIYVRGEYEYVTQILEKAIAEAYKAGYLGKKYCLRRTLLQRLQSDRSRCNGSTHTNFRRSKKTQCRYHWFQWIDHSLTG